MMRKKRWWVLRGVCAIFLACIAGLMTASPRRGIAKLQLAVLDQQIAGDAVIISVMASNAGPTVLISDDNYSIRYQMDGVWSTNSWPGHRSSIFCLVPGQVDRQKIKLPRGVARFQVGAGYEVAQGMDATAFRLYSTSSLQWVGNAIASIRGLFGNPRRPYVEFWDVEHEIRATSGKN